MSYSDLYFELAHTEEMSGNSCSALLFYLSSFCDSFNSGSGAYPCGAVAKIRMLQNQLSLPDQLLFDLVHSYGPLSDAECQKLLSDSIYGNLDGIKDTLAASAVFG